MTRRLRVALCLLAFLPLACAAGKGRITELDFVSSAWVDVDAMGHGRVEQVDSVTKLDKVPALAPAVARIKEVLKQRIESWEFIPATRDGVAVPSRTYLWVGMQGSDDGKGGLGLRILNAHGGPKSRVMTPPPYPPRAYKSGIEGRVILDISFDDQGAVTSAVLANPADPRAKNAEYFVDVARKAAKAWTFQTESVDGVPVPGRVRVPVAFYLSPENRMPEDVSKPETPRDGEYLALDPAVKLRSAVAGTAL